MYELFNLKRIVVFGREVTTAWKVETAAKKHLCMKILVRIPMSVRIGRAESKPKSGTRWEKYWTRRNFRKVFKLLLEYEISLEYPKN